jgi:high affinity cGMP-specific 3',5'-cyclic phosphodiesterase 9
MLENPYHNWFHVADVAQTVFSLGMHTGLLQSMSSTEQLALLVAALCHDLEHPVRPRPVVGRRPA